MKPHHPRRILRPPHRVPHPLHSPRHRPHVLGVREPQRRVRLAHPSLMLPDATVAIMAARRRATYQDVVDAPANMVAQILDGELVFMPRPTNPLAAAATALVQELGPPFSRGKGGPGGWLLLFEPELHLGEEGRRDILVPDCAGWRRERMSAVPAEPYVTLPPDWIGEVLSPSTAKLDRARKLPAYAREGARTVRTWC